VPAAADGIRPSLLSKLAILDVQLPKSDDAQTIVKEEL
jgi:hypothetical protein